MNTALFTHPACIEHDPGFGHPECPDRLRAVMQALEHEDFLFLARHEAPAATRDQLVLAHPADHVDRVLASIPPSGWRDIDADTTVNPHSGEAALRAAGAVCAAVDAVFTADSDPEGARNAFCAVRPPGHHAERARAMGFCLFNSVAIGAFHARRAHGIERVAVIDFDVHHGNGTQDIFWSQPGLLYASTHQDHFYPGTGAAAERGAGGRIVNAPLPAGSGSPEFRAAFERTVLPAVEEFAPELVMVSAGFDGHFADPLAQLELTEDDFVWATRKVCGVAAAYCGGRLVSVLEGGYDLGALARSTAAHVRELMTA